MKYLREYQSQLWGIVGLQEASKIIHESLYYIGMGNDDFGVSYFNFNPWNSYMDFVMSL